jgi:hypothetical protein
MLGVAPSMQRGPRLYKARKPYTGSWSRMMLQRAAGGQVASVIRHFFGCMSNVGESEVKRERERRDRRSVAASQLVAKTGPRDFARPSL